MPGFIKDSGNTWRSINKLSVNTGSWQDAKAAWIKDSSGNWQQWYSSGISWTYVGASSSSANSNVSFPSGAQIGDVGVFFDSTALSSPVTPSGWTTILQTNSTFELTISYKLLNSTDISQGTVTGSSSDTRYSVKSMLVFRPSTSVSNILIESEQTSNQTSSRPPNQTLPASPHNPETLVFGMTRSYSVSNPQLDGTFWDNNFYASGGIYSSKNYMRVYFEIQDSNTSRSIVTSSDYGFYNETASFTLNAS